MPKIFGFTGGTGNDWTKTNAYGDNEIDGIKDPDGGSGVILPTAIPSPFARIDLVKTAFKNISKSREGRLQAYTTPAGDVLASRSDEKLVSDCLDLAEILFNYDSLSKDIRIIPWDKDVEINGLKQGKEEHRRLGETLELFLDQDSKAYNFEKVRRLYIIQYRNTVIGCTSPVTLFFTSAGDLTEAQIRISNQDTAFDGVYNPLYNRDPEFQKYLYLLFEANPELQRNLKEFADYLKMNLNILGQTNKALFDQIHALDPNAFHSNYLELTTGTAGSLVEVMGVGLKKRNPNIVEDTIRQSDFVIRATKALDGKPPLVLQNEFHRDWKYINERWDSRTKVPYVAPEPAMDQRVLPDSQFKYPYLTVSDFLEPYLVRMIFPINRTKFFDGNLIAEHSDTSKGYLLPLKRRFFDYFSTDDLLQSGAGKPELNMVQTIGNAVKVSLKIPVQKTNEYITFERTYYEKNTAASSADEPNNKGAIVEQQLGLTVFPFVRVNDSKINPYYRMQVIDHNIYGPFKNGHYNLAFFANSDSRNPRNASLRPRSVKNTDSERAGTTYYVLEENYDFVEVSCNEVTGMVIPKWRIIQEGHDQFTFAIDFGTTNTHIEYKKDSDAPKPLDIGPEDMQIATLFDPARSADVILRESAEQLQALIELEFLPETLGGQSIYKFPHRTVIAENNAVDHHGTTHTLADFNIPFYYEKSENRSRNDKLVSNLKWANRDIVNDKRLTHYLEKLIMMIRNKVLLNNGNLSRTRLVWFYPSSMKPARLSSLTDQWNVLFKKYFKESDNSFRLSESLAPYFYFQATGRIPGSHKPVVSIDIGGGTTDVVIVQNNNPILISSFRFAANALFGDGYSSHGNAAANGLIQKYSKVFLELLSRKGHDDMENIRKVFIADILKEIIANNRSEEINAFLFSLAQNQKLNDPNTYSYSKKLFNDEDFKIVFLYFYVAIMYHLAEMFKAKALDLPEHIIFSGTGSKVLNIIERDPQKREGNLATLTKRVFELVIGKTYNQPGLTIQTDDKMPKELTCKGGLMAAPEQLNRNIDGLKTTWSGIPEMGFDRLSYSELNQARKESVIDHVQAFNKFFLELNDAISFEDYFEVSAASRLRFAERINLDLHNYLENGLAFNRSMDGVTDDDKALEDSLFFYPILGAIPQLFTELYNLNNPSQS
jgi:hypothetical protein